MPGLFETTDQPPVIAPPVAARRNRKRQWLNALLTSLGCHVCLAPAGEGCYCGHADSELLVQLDTDPALFAHVPRIARVIAARPTIRRLVLAQFDEGQVPEGLTGDKT